MNVGLHVKNNTQFLYPYNSTKLFETDVFILKQYNHHCLPITSFCNEVYSD